MRQLTKPEIIDGELSVHCLLTNQNTKALHEALLFYLRSKTNTAESSYIEIKDLREEVLKLRRAFNPS
jgi:hypothetical protein